MAVENKSQTQEQKEAENQETQSKRDAVAEDILSTLDLPTDEEIQEKVTRPRTGEERTKAKEEKKEQTKEPEKPIKETEKETEEEMTAEELLKTPDEELTDEGLEVKKTLQKEMDNDDELIPKSKVDKRFKALTREINELKSQLKAAPEAAVDPDITKLNKKTPAELKDLKRSVRSKIRTEVDESKLEDLYSLEDKIEDATNSYPQRFLKRQSDLRNDVIADIGNDPDVRMTKEAESTIVQYAKDIYQRYPKFAKMEEGQAMALKLAVDYYKNTSQVTEGKQERQTLKRFASKLKKRTTLDSNVLKRDAGKSNLTNIKKRAHDKGATSLDKLDFIKNSPTFKIDDYIPDSLKGR